MTEFARQIRRDIIRMVYQAGSGHIGGAMGAVEVLESLYTTGALAFRPDDPSWAGRDRLVLSSGHICAAWYAVLARTGQIPIEELASHRRFGSRLQGHPARVKLGNLVETSSGPLGQGLSVAVGMALGMRLDRGSSRVFCILGDGELAEGQIWESAMSASHHRAANVTAVVLANGLQIDGATEDVKTQEPIVERFRAFGWRSLEIDGHDLDHLYDAFTVSRDKTRPLAVVARVVMAKGVSSWENLAKWHGAVPTPNEARMALDELGTVPGYDDFPIPMEQERCL